MPPLNRFRTVLMRSHAAKYAACVVLACAAAVLVAVPVLGQTTTVTLVGAGDIAKCDLRYDEQTAQLLGNTLASLSTPARVVTLGDNAYSSGTRAQFANCYDNYRLSDGSPYDPSRPAWWGKYKDRTMPSLGNHEYLNSTDPNLKSKPYFDYFSAKNGFKLPSAPVPNTADNPGLTQGRGYYSYDLGSWHIVALNSNDHCAYVSCSSESAQAEWLRNDLATNPRACTLAYMHHPLYATGSGGRAPEVKPLVQILYDHGADVMLNAHNHRYERLAQIDPDGNLDPATGIRTITAGTGGDPGEGTTATPPLSSEVRIFGTAGILRMDLSDTSYSWQFVAVDGTANGSVMDSGTESCHGEPGSVDTTAPTVTNVAPAENATDVAVAANVEAAFSEAMDENSVETSGNFTLIKEGTTASVAATVSYDPATDKATLNPNTDLEAGVTYTATVKGGANGVKDAAGNPLAADKVWTFTTAGASQDATPPETTIDSRPAALTNSSSASFSFSSNEAGSSFECKLDSGSFTSCTSPQNYSNLSEGSHTFQVRATDVAGNVEATLESYSWTVDTTEPETTIDSGPSGTVKQKDASFTFSSSEPSSTFECSLDSADFRTCSSPTTYTGLANGSHTLQVRAIDAARNIDPTPASHTWKVRAR